MATKVFGIAVALAILLGAPAWVAAQSPLEGAWDLQEWQLPVPADSGMVIFHGERYAFVVSGENRPNLAFGAQQTASADELRAAWGAFMAHAGTFELTGGDTLTLRASTAKDSVQSGDFIEFRCALEDDGNTLVLTPVRNQNGELVERPAARFRRADCCAR